MSDRRDRELDEMLEAARTERATAMSEDDAARVFSAVLARVRAEPRSPLSARLGVWLAGLAAAAAVAFAVAAPPRSPGTGERRVARQTLIHIESGGREVLIQAIAYEGEE